MDVISDKQAPLFMKFNPKKIILFISGNKPDDDDEVRPPPCVGICYYNKLVALEAKEDLTRHNEVYKQVNGCFWRFLLLLLIVMLLYANSKLAAYKDYPRTSV